MAEYEKDAKERILQVSERLFSEKGYDAARVSEIAEAANVNKALIYYYFDSKQAILDHLLQGLFDDLHEKLLTFIRQYVIGMIASKRLDILPDRFHFVDKEAAAEFSCSLNAFYAEMVDYLLMRKDLVRILMLESLKGSKHHNDIVHLLEYMKVGDNNIVYRTISEADSDFTYSSEMTLFAVFYIIMPATYFVSYYDDCLQYMDVTEQQLRGFFLKSISAFAPAFVSGTDFMLTIDKK